MTNLIRRIQTAALLLLTGALLAYAQRGPSISGQWEGERSGERIVYEFLPNGVFSFRTGPEKREVRGHYSINGENLQLLSAGQFFADQYRMRFDGIDTIQLDSVAGGQSTLRLKRVKPHPPIAAQQNRSVKLAPTLFQRVWEPNEKAFSLLVPEGWKTAGGVFRADPARLRGLGNSSSPKCDFAVSQDDRGTVMIRWIPSWNYEDLSRNATGAGIIRPGQYHNGMLVKPLLDARQFLSEVIRAERPKATGLRVIAEDPMTEISLAFAKKTEEANVALQKRGLDPMRIVSLGLVVEYQEAGQTYRESLLTTMVDNRNSFSLWFNENTLMFRAPAAEFDAWKPVLDIIRSSREPNREWLRSLEGMAGPFARQDWETQFDLEEVSGSVIESRRAANSENGSEKWLFPDLQNGYRFSWESNRGELLYADDADFNPNSSEFYKNRSWKMQHR
jgi:hypothetical protein